VDTAIEYDELNLLRLWQVVAKRRWLIITVCVSVTAVSIGLSYLIAPVYRADVLVTVADEQSESGVDGLVGQFGGLAALAGIDVASGRSQSMNEAIEILRSRAFTERFIEQEKVLPILFPARWDRERKCWLPDDTGDAVPPSAWRAYKRLNSARKIAKDTKTGFVKLSIEWGDPALAAHWANSMVRMLNDHLRVRAVEEAQRSTSYLQEQLDQTTVIERRQMFVRLMETETRKIVLAKARPEYAVRVLDAAVVPEEKVRPRRPIIAIAALLIGALIGVIAALAIEQRRT
jgi:uncharacterized protein involved in exopolysaccharide biosynthesis